MAKKKKVNIILRRADNKLISEFPYVICIYKVERDGYRNVQVYCTIVFLNQQRLYCMHGCVYILTFFFLFDTVGIALKPVHSK